MRLGKSFDRLFGSALASHISDGLLATSAPLLATTLTKDPVLISGLAALLLLPWLLLGIPIGGLLDRINRRKALAFSAIVKLGSAAGISLAIATGTMNIWVLYLATFLIGAAEVVSDTAMQSMLPQLLKANQIETANSRLNIAQTVLGNFIGTPLGGLLYAVAIWIPFAANSLGFAVAAAFLLLIPIKIKSDWDSAMVSIVKERASFWQDIKFGVKYLWTDKMLLRLVVTTATIGFVFNVATSTFILFLLDVMYLPAEYFGLILAADGVAAILGSLCAPWFSRKYGRSRTLAFAIVISVFSTALSGFVPNLWWFIPLVLVDQFSLAVWNILLMSTYHELIPNHLFGRIHGTRRTLVWGMMPIGAIIGGFIAKVNLRAPYLVLLIVGGLVAVFSVKFIASLPQKNQDEPAQNLTEALPEDDRAGTIE